MVPKRKFEFTGSNGGEKWRGISDFLARPHPKSNDVQEYSWIQMSQSRETLRLPSWVCWALPPGYKTKRGHLRRFA